MSRTQLLEEYVAQNTCSCESPGFCLSLMKEILHANGLDGLFQYEVYSALEKGRAKKRNICLVGDADCGKSFLLKGLLDVFVTYTRPKGGSHQLEDLLEAEIVFLNDCEYDSTAPSWMPWSYFKDFLEGSKVKVAIPKNKGGGNQLFKGTAPVFLTCAQEVVLKKYGKEVEKEQHRCRNASNTCISRTPSLRISERKFCAFAGSALRSFSLKERHGLPP